MQEALINRLEDLSFLSSLVPQQDSEENSLVFVKAATGVGKTALCTEFLNKHLEGRIPVRANVKISEISRGYFIYRLANEIDRLARKGLLIPLEEYTTSIATKYLAERHNRRLADEVLSTSIGKNLRPVATMIEKRVSPNLVSPTASLALESDHEYWELLDYIKFNADNRRLAVNIENVQSLDPLSRDILLELVDSTKGTLFVFEYTEESESEAYDIDDLCDAFSAVCGNVSLRTLSWLPLHELLQSSRIDMRKLIKRAYYEVNGNLRALRDLEVLVIEQKIAEGAKIVSSSETKLSSTLGPTKLLIESLPKSDLLILCAIAFHKGVANRSQLNVLYDLLPSGFEIHVDIELSLDRLREHHLIVERGPEFSIVHDSISIVIDQSQYIERYKILVLQVWRQYYEGIIEEKAFDIVPKAAALQLLFHIYLKLDITRISKLMPEISDLALQRRYPKEITHYLEELVSSIPTADASYRRDILTELARIYYKAGLFEDAWKKVEELGTSEVVKDPILTILRIALLDRLELHENALSEIEQLTFAPPQNLTENQMRRFELCLIIIKLVSLRSLNRYDDCRQLFYSTRQRRKEFDLFFEWGFFLRNGEIVMDTKGSMEIIEEAILFFNENRSQRQEALCRISLSLYFCFSGNIDSALQQTKLADTLLGPKFLEEHIIKSNATAMELYAGKIDPREAIGEFRSCLRTAVNSFDRIVVMNNMFVSASLAGQYTYADDVFKSLLNILDAQPDKELAATVNFNRFFYMELNGMKAEAQTHLQAARKAVPEGDVFWDARLLRRQAPENYDEQFLLTFPYQLSFISNWHFDVPYAL